MDTGPPATPTAAQTAPPPAPPATAAAQPAKPTKVIPLHVRGTGAAGTTAASATTTTAAPAAAACLDAASTVVGSCASMVAPDASCAATSTSHQRCAAYQANFNPKVAAAATLCMTGLTGTQQCDASLADGCARSALGQSCADSSVAQLCGVATSVCKASAGDCSTLLSGLNAQGKQGVAQC
ncbi:MAG TPA: hypothetical protein VMI75_26655, partial [Polyangiaceae bacterium]|nr:hypothetical protein [Polyangiaceae bacterium]